MGELVHKYYCNYCQVFVFGVTANSLCYALNQHNDKLHPADCSSWSPASVVKSAHYSAPSIAPDYVVPYASKTHSEEWGDAPPPIITTRDHEILASGLVRW